MPSNEAGTWEGLLQQLDIGKPNGSSAALSKSMFLIGPVRISGAARIAGLISMMCAREFSKDLTGFSELRVDFNDAVGSKQYGVGCRIEQSKFGSFTIHYDQRCIRQMSAKLTGSHDPDRVASFNRIANPTA
jgi:hypothetical protein